MKVLHLIDSGGLYGAEKVLLALVKEQLRQGLEPMILSAGSPDIAEKAIEAEAVRLGLPIKPWRMRPGLNMGETRKILAWAKAEGFTLLHSHGYKFNILLAAERRRNLGLPLITTLHGYVKARPFTKMWFYEVIDRLVLKRMDAVVLVNEQMRELAPVKRLGAITAVHIPNGIELETCQSSGCLTERPDIETFIREHTFSIVAVGRLSPEKSFDTAISALALLRESGENIGLCIMGTGALQHQLVELTEALKLEDHVYFAGYVNEASNWVKMFDCLVMPSLTEGLPVTLLEAMKSRVPIVASRVGGIPHAVVDEESALLITPGSKDELAASVDRIRCSESLARTLCQHANESLREHFSASAMASRYLQVYCGVTGQKKRRGVNE